MRVLWLLHATEANPEPVIRKPEQFQLTWQKYFAMVASKMFF